MRREARCTKYEACMETKKAAHTHTWRYGSEKIFKC